MRSLNFFAIFPKNLCSFCSYYLKKYVLMFLLSKKKICSYYLKKTINSSRL